MIWIIGSKTQTGSELARILTENKINWIGSDGELAVSEQKALDAYVLSHDSEAGRTGNAVARGKVPEKIKWVVNCLEYVDFSESPETINFSNKINIEGARNIARTARQLGAKLIHLSTAFVFDGSSSNPYTEESERNAVSLYGKTKALGEEAIQKEMTQYYIIRPSWIYGFENYNIVYNLMNKINGNTTTPVLNDRFGMPVSSTDVAELIFKIINTSEKATSLFGKNSAIPYGIYHFASNESISLYDFAGKLYDYCKIHSKLPNDCDITPGYGTDEDMFFKLPPYLNLDCSKLLGKLKIRKPKWKDSLDKFVKNRKFTPGRF